MNTRSIFLVALLGGGLMACNNLAEADATEAKTSISEEEQTEGGGAWALNQIWDSETYYPTCESVLYDEKQDLLYVSCIAGNPTEKDGSGHIARMTLDGKIIDSVWAHGFNAPKGMCFFNGQLYVTDIDKLVRIDMENPELKVEIPVPGSEFLNDLTAGPRGVFMSDMKTGMLYYVEADFVHTINEDLPNLNGLAFFEDQLYALNDQGLLRLSQGGEVMEVLNDEVTGGDGLIPLGQNRFIASRWQGEIWIVDNGKAEKLFDSTADNLQTADIGYNPKTATVFAPRFFANRVTAFKLAQP